MGFAFLDALFGIPVVVFNFTEQFSVHHHLSTTGFVVLKGDEFAIAKLGFPVGQMLGNDVGVNIDREEALMGNHDKLQK
jgi:hypothetical protein